MVIKKFELGITLCSKGIADLIDAKGNSAWNEVNKAAIRYASCDWGDTCEEDKVLNDAAVKNGNDRIVAKYILSDDVEIFIITKADRGSTTIMLTEEY